MRFNGTSWVPVGSVGFSAGIANYTSIAFDAGGMLYVVYQDNANANKATVMKFNGTGWVAIGSAGFSAGKANWTSMAFAGSGTPYVVYQDEANASKATVMKFNGTSWVLVGAAGFSTGDSPSPDIAIDGSGTPYVVCGSIVISNKITVMKFNGTGWSNLGTPGFAGGSSAGNNQYTSIAIDGSGMPYVAFSRDFNNSEKTTVMSYKEPPIVTVNSATVCPGNTVKFFPGGAMAYSITGGSFIVNPLVTTSYTVTGAAVNGCTNSAVATVSVKVCVGINELSEGENLNIYPNPANDILKIDAGETINKIEISDYTGKQTGVYFPGAKYFEMNEHQLPAGLYLLKITTASYTVVRRVVIEAR
jgi:hypothetical protein